MGNIEDILKKPVTEENLNEAIESRREAEESLRALVLDLENKIDQKNNMLKAIDKNIVLMRQATNEMEKLERIYNVGGDEILKENDYVKAKQQYDTALAELSPYDIECSEDYDRFSKRFEKEKNRYQKYRKKLEKLEEELAELTDCLFKQGSSNQTSNKAMNKSPSTEKENISNETKRGSHIKREEVSEPAKKNEAEKAPQQSKAPKRVSFKELQNEFGSYTSVEQINNDYQVAESEIKKLRAKYNVAKDINAKIKKIEGHLDSYENKEYELRCLNDKCIKDDGTIRPNVDKNEYDRERKSILSAMDIDLKYIRDNGIQNRMDFDEKSSINHKDMTEIPKTLERLYKKVSYIKACKSKLQS